MLENWVGDPRKRDEKPASSDSDLERSGTPPQDAADLLGWLIRWLRNHLFARRPGSTRVGKRASEAPPADAWAAYQRLLTWADQQGLGRRPAETTGQLSARLATHTPAAAHAVDLVTRTYEWERYGGLHPRPDGLRRVKEALRSLLEK